MGVERDFTLRKSNNFVEWISNADDLIESTRDYISACELLNTIREYPDYYTNEDAKIAVENAVDAYYRMTRSLDALGTQS